MALTFSHFRKTVLGKGYNIDGYYGAQCWDGFAQYCKYWGYPVINTSLTGYAKDLWNDQHFNGILHHFRACSEPKVGDVVIYTECPSAPKSHVGIVSKIYSNKLLVLGQNQGGKLYPGGGSVFNEIYMSRVGVLGYFRPIALSGDSLDSQVLNRKPKEFIKQKSTFTVVYPKGLTIWNAPNVKYATSTGLKYNNGDSVIIDGYVNHDGYRWVSWISVSTNKRRWMRAGKVNSNGAIVSPFGRFR